MTSVLNIALTGLHHNRRGMETVAQNIANVNTDGHRAQRYDPASGSTRPRYDEPVLDDGADLDLLPPSDVDLATEFVDLKRYQIGYRANAVLITAADRLTGELLDLLG